MVMRIRIGAAIAALVLVLALAGGCRLGPLVEDLPGASANLLPRGSTVPSVLDNHDLAGQIALHDGLGDAAPDAAIVVPLGTGVSEGAEVHYWSFGAATSATSPLYLFFQDTGAGLAPIDHLGMVDALPGEAGYSPLHMLFRVVVTPAYAGQLITTPAALADAIELGLVNEPEPMGSFIASPVVLPTTTLEVGAGAPPTTPTAVYARGYTVGTFLLGGDLGVQPGSGGLASASNVSFLREARAASFDLARPIFQATIPTPALPIYTPLSAIINVDLAPGVQATAITRDGDLFTRSPSGVIIGTSERVSHFEVTDQVFFFQLQFMEGMP